MCSDDVTYGQIQCYLLVMQFVTTYVCYANVFSNPQMMQIGNFLSFRGF